MKFLGVIAQENLCFEDLTLLSKTLKKLEGEKVTIEIKKRVQGRSMPQNRYYHSVVVKILSDETGYTLDEMHEVLKYKFLLQEGDMPYVKSTTSLTVPEFEEYLRLIRMWASSELQTYIPGPGEPDLDLIF